MKKNLILLLLALNSYVYAQNFTALKGDYLGQIPQGNTPVVFARGIVSTDDVEHSAPAFSPDGNELFWWVYRWPESGNNKGTNWVMTIRRIGDKWTVPAVSPYNREPVFSPDGKRLFFRSGDTSNDPYFVEKQGNSWSEPKTVGLVTSFPELQCPHNLSIARNGTLHFCGYAEGLGLYNNYGIYRAELINGEYAKPQLLPRGINLPPFQNGTPFIAPDESYLVFSSNRDGEFGNGDLYISFHDISTDTWCEPVNMGALINTRSNERFPGVSPDGKYLFFTRWIRNKDHDVFWVSAKVIDESKKENMK